jgi:hypothetical protein
LDVSPAGRVGIEPEFFYRLLIIGLADVIAGYGDLASHHSNKIDHATGETDVVEDKSVNQGIKLAMNIFQRIVCNAELNDQSTWFSGLRFHGMPAGIVVDRII